MIRLLALLVLFALPAAAQEPVLRVDLDRAEAIPGQSVNLRVTVLVPTFLPEPPVWPDYAAPNLVVRVASTGPVSERIDGATWSGVSRRYLIAPMLPGRIDLPAKEVRVTWADPETNEPRQTALRTEPLGLTGVVPRGAEGLDPFIAADGLQLEQTVAGTAEGMAPGDSLIRTVTATITGTSPMFLPPLLPPHAIDGVRAYPDSPVIDETSERGVVRGTRTERVTLIAEGGGKGAAPAVTLDWFNLQTGAVERAELPAIAVSVAGPPAATAGSEPRDWRAIIRAVLLGLLVLVPLALALRRLAPVLRGWAARRRADWLASEPHAWRGLRHAVKTRDHRGLRPALDRWAARVPGADPRRDPRLSAALASLGAARFGPHKGDEEVGWRQLARTLNALRHRARARSPAAVLPPLNPGH